jgi:hypothetical protein
VQKKNPKTLRKPHSHCEDEIQKQRIKTSEEMPHGRRLAKSADPKLISTGRDET